MTEVLTIAELKELYLKGNWWFAFQKAMEALEQAELERERVEYALRMTEDASAETVRSHVREAIRPAPTGGRDEPK